MKSLVIGIIILAVVFGVFAFVMSDSINLAPSPPPTSCQIVAPTVTVTPASQIGSPGLARSYIVRVRNNNLGPSCGTTQFNLFDILPDPSWTSTFGGTPGPMTFNLCQGCSGPNGFLPNATVGVSYELTSSTGALPGNYDAYIISFETGQNQAGIATATYII